MSRVLGCVQNEMEIEDNISRSSIVLHYRMPTASERLAYSSMAVSRKGDKVNINYTGARQHYGAVILTGFRAGDFKRVKDGVEVPMASAPDHPDYFSGWQDLMVKYCSDALETLAIAVFETSCNRAAEKVVEAAPEPPKGDEPTAPDDAQGN